ncbi:MAG: LysR family transcriptional regulator [Methylomarinum sp.]|nr:LysR family transcriptional regulator [Methylomarinum sp.]
MNLNHLDLNLLVAFDALMTEKNVSKAAEKLFIGQSAMSHSLNRLRQTLDDPILVRTTKGMKPTARAEALIVPIRKALLEIEMTVTSKPEFIPKTAKHQFIIAATDYNELILLPSLLNKVHGLAPGVNIHVRQTSEYMPEEELENGSINVVLGFDVSLETPSRINQQALFNDVFVSIVRKDHPTIGDTLSLEQYTQMDHILISPSGSEHGIVDHWLHQNNLNRKIALIVPHFLSAPLIIAQTDMVLTLPYRVAEKFVQMAPLKLLHTPIALPSYQLSMTWHPLYEKDPADQWIRNLIATVGQQIADNPIPLKYLSNLEE